MFYTYFGGVEPNYSNINRIEGHLRSIKAIPSLFQGHISNSLTLTIYIVFYTSVTHPSYLSLGHKTKS